MSTTPAWDDPVIVASVAAQLLGKTANNHRTALRHARDLLRQAAYVIKEEQTLAAKEKELAAYTAALLADMPVDEHVFIDQMIEGLCNDQRFDRRKAFFEQRWIALCQQHPHTNPPGLDEQPKLFTSETLHGFYSLFQQVCRMRPAKRGPEKNSKKVLNLGFRAACRLYPGYREVNVRF